MCGRWGPQMSDRFARIAAATGGAFFIGFGVWGVVDPRSFYDNAAVWPPFNVHFVHDIGAFQIGLGAALLLSLIQRDSLFVVLAGVGIGQGVHAAMHVVDRDLGGRATDPLVMTVIAVVLSVGAFLRLRSVRT